MCEYWSGGACVCECGGELVFALAVKVFGKRARRSAICGSALVSSYGL